MHYRYRFLIILFSIIVISVFIQSCQPENNQKSDQVEEKDELIKQIEAFNTAFRDGEVEKLESMITTNYLHTNSHSKPIRKDDWMAYLERRKKALVEGRLIVDEYEMTETEIEMYGDMAIVSGKISFKTIQASEQKENEIRVTNIWVKENGIWKRAGFHDSRIK